MVERKGFKSSLEISSLEEMKMVVEASERIRRIFLLELHSAFQDCPENLLGRGSYIYLHLPVDDTDVSSYSKNGVEDLNQEVLPREILGIPIEYGGIPQGELAQYLKTNLRAVLDPFDVVVITTTDEHVLDVLDDAKKNTHNLLPYGVLYRLFEEEYILDKRGGDPYSDAKEMYGSKRTLQRSSFITRSISPKFLEEVNINALIYGLIEEGIMPLEIGLAHYQLSPALRSLDNSKIAKLTSKIGSWYGGVLKPIAEDYVRERIPSDYLGLLNLLKDKSQKSKDFSQFMNEIEGLSAHQRWLALKVLSVNPSCDPDILLDLWHRLKNKYPYLHVTRSLVENPSFPREKMNSEPVPFQTHI